MLLLIKKYKLYIIGAILGAIGGYIYWYNWGCINGCTITGNKVNMTLYGALMGSLLFGIFQPNTKTTKNEI